jgi:hypothetical protein
MEEKVQDDQNRDRDAQQPEQAKFEHHISPSVQIG